MAACGGPESSETSLQLEVRSSVAGDSAFLAVVLENMPQAAFSCNVDGSADFLSTRARVLQTSPDPAALLGAGPSSLLHPDDRELHAAAWATSLGSGQPHKHEIRLLRPGGGFHWFEVCINPLRDERGRILKWLGTVTDREETRRLITAVEDERALLLTVLDQLPVGVMVADPGGALRVRNCRSREIWQGATPVVRSVAEFDQYVGFHADGRRYAAGDWPLARTLSNGEVVTGEETIFQRLDGSRGVMRVSSSPVVNAAGAVVAGCVVFEDISELRRMQEEHTRRLAAEEAAHAKRALLTVVSHELR
jgi:PAS domain S-box-containing protein